jgi:anthranilate phosphoribosyltransferase
MKEFKKILEEVIRGRSIGRDRARQTMGFMMSPDGGEARIAAFLAALEAKGVDQEELTGFAEGMRARAVTVQVDREPLVDTCGTGGDGLETFNFSTAAALVVAGAGIAVAKHGNRAVSSKSGSADLLEYLGIRLDRPAEAVKQSIEDVGFGFFFAPNFHPSMMHVAPVRKALGIRTVFNLLGPLANPAQVRRQVIGISRPSFAPAYAHVLAQLGAERAMVVHGEDGMDEFTLTGKTRIYHVEGDGRIHTEEVAPEDVGLKRVAPEALRGGTVQENAGLLESLLQGAQGPLLDCTLLNAAASLVVAGTADTLAQGMDQARESVQSGSAMKVLESLQKG